MKLAGEAFHITTMIDITERKQAEESLRQSEQKFSILFQKAAFAAALSRLPDGVMVDINEAFERAFGYTKQEVAGKTSQELGINPDAEGRARILSVLQGQDSVRDLELMLKTKSGVTRVFLVNIDLVDIGGQKHILQTAQDITERKQTEVALQRYTQRLETLHQIDQAILAAESVEDTAAAALERLVQIVPCLRADVSLFDATDQMLETLVTHRQGRISFGQGFHIPVTQTTLDFKVLRQGQLHQVADYQTFEPIAPSLRDLTLQQGLRASVAAPLLAGGELIGLVGLGRAEAGLFAAEEIEMIREIADQLAIALQQARLHESVSQARERLEILTRQLLETQEMERRRLARELHDEIGQSLSLVKIDLHTTQQLLQPTELAAPLNESVDLVEQALQQVRALSVELRPSLLDDLGLIPALRWYVDRQAQRGKFTARFAADPLPERLAPELETVCFRLVQEALTNTLRYAQAGQVEVELKLGEAELRLVVRDDGVGFDAPAALEQAARGGSLGLLGMQERAALIGGRLEIQSAPGHGAEIRAILPLKYAAPAEAEE